MRCPKQLYPLPSPDSDGAGFPFADTIHRNDCRLVERRRKKGRGRVSLVVAGKRDAFLKLTSQSFANFPRQVELRLQPPRNALQERANPDRRRRQVRLDEPIKLQERLFIENHVSEVARRNPALAQAILHCFPRESLIVFRSRKSLLLRRRHDLAATNQRSRTVVV